MAALLEREDDLRSIDQAIAAALGGRTAVVMVLGPPGIGTTSLLEAAVERAEGQGFQVRSSTFTPLGATGVASLLWDLFPEAATGASEDAPFSGPAGRLVRAVHREDAPDADAASAAALAYAAQWAVSGLAATRPQLIAVDELHWADETSLRLLASLALRVRGERVVFVMTSRPGGEIDRTLAALLAAPRTVLLEPSPLSAAAVAELADAEGVGEPARLHELSRGNPFYVRELLAGGGSASTRLSSSIRVRLDRLGPDARNAVETLAVAGGSLRLTLLGLAADADVARMRSAFSELDLASFAVVDEGALRLTHPILVEAIADGLTLERRSLLHERIADAMHEEGTPTALIAAHEMHAQPTGDRRRIGVMIEAARLAETNGAPAAAATAYARARHEGGLDEATRIELALAEGRARTMAGDGEAGLALIGDVVAAIEDPLLRGTQWARLGDLAYMAGNMAESAAAYERARAALDTDGEASEEARLILAKLLASEGTLRTDTWSTVLALAEEAAAREDGIVDRADAAFSAVAALAMVLTEGPSAESRQAAERSLAAGLAPGGGDDPITYVLSGALSDLAMFDEAEEWLRAALDDVRERGSAFGFATASYARGALRFRFGRIRSGLADLEASWSGIGLGWHTYFYPIRHYLVLALLRTGERERAIEVAGTPPRGPEPAFPLIGRMTRFVAALASDDVEAAVAHADSLIGEPNPFTQAGIEWRPLMAEAYLRRGGPGDAERARLLIRDALDKLGERALPLHRAAIIFDAARLAVDDEAESLYAQVLQLVGEDPVYEAAASRLALARFAFARGELDRAREGVRLALEYAMNEGVRPLSAEAYDLLMLIDPSPSLIDADERLSLLSASELRIATAAARGHSNRRIAQESFVTIRTVEFHLTNVYRKLSISSRDELRRIIPAWVVAEAG